MSFSEVLLKQQDRTKESYTNSLKKCISKKRKYTLRGKPIPLQRVKRAIFPSHHAYDSQKKLKEESQLDLRMQHGYCKLIEGPIALDVTFFMQIPQSYSTKKKASLVGQPHTKRPDLSNLIKYLEDVAQGIIFRDDAIIDKITAKKVYGEPARTEFTIINHPKEENDTEKDQQA